MHQCVQFLSPSRERLATVAAERAKSSKTTPMHGWVRIPREILDSKVFSDAATFQLFFYLVSHANTRDASWNGMTVQRGQFVTTQQQICRDLGLTRKALRHRVELLHGKMIEANQRANRFTIITIYNFDTYVDCQNVKGPTEGPTWGQPKGQPKGQQNTIRGGLIKSGVSAEYKNGISAERLAKGQPKGQPKGHKYIYSIDSKEEKKVKKDNTLIEEKENVKRKSVASLPTNTMSERQQAFGRELIPFVDIYGKEMVREFFNYWTEPNKSQTKFRKELEKTWSTKLRLATWAKRQKTYKNGNTQQYLSEGREGREREWRQHCIDRLRNPDNEAEEAPPTL